MDDVFVARIMSPDPTTVTEDTLVEEAAATMLEAGIGSVLVVDDAGELRGILTSTDFVRIVAEHDPKDQTPVGDYMSTELVTTSAQDNIHDAADMMIENDLHHLPVVDEDAGLIGIITTTDLAAYVSDTVAPSPP
ncbi:MAG: CBS domain-containing protein [Haloarculaceae archaeon]